MVIIAAQTPALSTEPGLMALPTTARVAITHERLENLVDLVDFDEKILKQITDNLRRPGGCVPDPYPNVAG